MQWKTRCSCVSTSTRNCRSACSWPRQKCKSAHPCSPSSKVHRYPSWPPARHALTSSYCSSFWACLPMQHGFCSCVSAYKNGEEGKETDVCHSLHSSGAGVGHDCRFLPIYPRHPNTAQANLVLLRPTAGVLRVSRLHCRRLANLLHRISKMFCRLAILQPRQHGRKLGFRTGVHPLHVHLQVTFQQLFLLPVALHSSQFVAAPPFLQG